MRSFWRGYGMGFGVDAGTEYQRSALGLRLEEIRGHLPGLGSGYATASEAVTRGFTNHELPGASLNVRGHLVRHVRQDTDRIPQPLDFRLAIPAGALWVSLLVAGWCGGLDLVPSCWVAGVALVISVVVTGVARTQSRKRQLYPADGNCRQQAAGDSRPHTEISPDKTGDYCRTNSGKHRLYPLGSAAALTALAAFAVGLGFAGHAANLAIAARDPLAAIGADPSHRFEIQAQVITTPRLITFSHGSGKSRNQSQPRDHNQPQNQSNTSRRSTPIESRPAPPSGTATTPLSGIVPTPHLGFLTTSQPATATSQTESATTPRPETTRTLQTRLVTTPSSGRDTKPSGALQSYRVTLQAHYLTWRGTTYRTRAKLQVKGKGWEGIELGSTVRLRTGLARLDPSGEFLGFLKAPGTPRVVAPPSGRFFFVNAVRTHLTEASTHLAPETRAMIGAMSLGLTQNQTPSDREAMQISGLSHLTAVSGLHLSVLLGLALGLTSRAPRAVQVTAASTLMVAFLCMLEGSASVTRAATMGAITLLGLALARPAKSVSALSLAVTGMLLVSPWQATSWGFALSVVATLSIVTLGQALSQWLAAFLPRFLAFPLAISLSAQLGCQPLMLVLRGKLQLFSLPANLLTGAISSVVTIGGLLLVVLAATTHLGVILSQLSYTFAPICHLFVAPLTSLTHLTAQVTGLAANWILGVARFFSRLQGAEIPWIESGYGVFGILVVTVAFLWLTGRCAYIRHWSVGSRSPFHFHEPPS